MAARHWWSRRVAFVLIVLSLVVVFGASPPVAAAQDTGDDVAPVPGGSIQTSASPLGDPDQGCDAEVCPNAIIGTGNGAYVELATYLDWNDYWQRESVRGRNTAQFVGGPASAVQYLQAGGALLRDDDGVDPYAGSIMATTDTGRVGYTTFVDTGWTGSHGGWDDYWIMTGHTYFKIWNNENSTFQDNHHDFS